MTEQEILNKIKNLQSQIDFLKLFNSEDSRIEELQEQIDQLESLLEDSGDTGIY